MKSAIARLGLNLPAAGTTVRAGSYILVADSLRNIKQLEQLLM